MHSVWLGVAAGLMSTALTMSAQAGTGKPLAAVWKEQHVNFNYMGRTSRYSCYGLRDKMRAILLDLGVRPEPRITATCCEESAARARLNSPSPRLSIVFSSPALPNATLKPLHSGDLAAVDARFESFTITSDAFRNMGSSDCELVEEFARQVLPKLVTRNLQQRITCVPYQQSGSRFLVRGEVLRALPPGTEP